MTRGLRNLGEEIDSKMNNDEDLSQSHILGYASGYHGLGRSRRGCILANI